MLKDNTDARYLVCNAGKPETLLGASVISELFGKNRKVAVGFNGVAFFLTNDEVAHAMKTLYDWADTGSRLFLCDTGIATLSPVVQETFSIYEKLGQPTTFRSIDTLKQLISPWRVREPGFQPLEAWVDLKGG
jgi:hypothetical protein